MTKHVPITDASPCTATIDFDNAQAILAAHALPLGEESVPISEADGRRLVAAVVAQIDAPRRDCAAMDGYAVRDADLRACTVLLRPAGTSYAGDVNVGSIRPGETWRVMTGAPLPLGADRVMMIEHCRSDRGLVILQNPQLGKPHIRRQGSDFAAGDMLLPVGTKMTAPRLVAAAAADCGSLIVSRRPRVQLLVTGDEIASPGSASGRKSATPDSLSDAINSLCISAGAEVVSKLWLPDEERAILNAHAESHTDVIVIIGGASRGDRDFGRSAFSALGLELAFADVAMKPGKPVWYGRMGPTHVLGIPGNPTAALTIARLFLTPLICGLSHGPIQDALPWQLRPTTKPIPANGAREAFLCGCQSYEGVALSDRQEASGQFMLGSADCLVRRPANAAPVPEGALVPVLPLC